MHGFCDRGAESAGGTERNDVPNVVHHRVLPGERESLLANAGSFKYLSVSMEPVKGLLDGTELALVDGGMSDQVTEVEKCSERPDHVTWDVPLNSW